MTIARNHHGPRRLALHMPGTDRWRHASGSGKRCNNISENLNSLTQRSSRYGTDPI